MTVAYDGTAFHGVAPNAGVRTVMGELAGVVAPFSDGGGDPTAMTCAGRTDKGVHAWSQVLSFDLPDGTDLSAVQRAVSRRLGPEVVCRSIDQAEPGFDARFDATGRRYRYTIVNRPEPDPFRARYAWHVPDPLDVRAMRAGADPLVGEHDFSSFCRAPKVSDPTVDPPSLVRRVREAEWVEVGRSDRPSTRPARIDPEHMGVLRFEIEASSFCQQMVRSIVGLLVEVGRGRRSPGDVLRILRARDRAGVPTLAPPHGLCLWDVSY